MAPRTASALARRTAPVAVVGGVVASELLDVTTDPAALTSTGWWAVVVPFDGVPTFARFARRRPTSSLPRSAREWVGPDRAAWRSSLDRDGFAHRVAIIRAAIAEGDVYQVNLTRLLRAPLDPDASMLALGHELAIGNPAPYAA